jgi:tRNA 5-methylaminomethyl-2-thiouridine biosynthesis bifunctional protein
VHLLGATFDPDDDDDRPRDADDAANVEQLRAHLPGHWQALGADALRIVGRRVGFRCQAIDFLPLAGPADPGVGDLPLLVNVAHGSRGITGTALTAELVADRLAGLPPAVDSAIADALAPARFDRRRAASRDRRRRSSRTAS